MEELNVGGYNFKISQDSYVETPREWCNLATFVFCGNHTHLGDENESENLVGHYKKDKKYLKKAYDAVVVVPVYALIHGGMTISLDKFSCPWDSGQIGWALITKEAVRKNWDIKRVTKKYKAKAEKIIKSEVNTLDSWIRGSIYGFNVESVVTGEEVDSCWGFYGDDHKASGLIDEMVRCAILTRAQIEEVTEYFS